VLHSRIGSWPYPQTLGSPARDKHSSLLRKFVNYGRKKFYDIGPWCRRKEPFFFVTDSLAKKLECLYLSNFDRGVKYLEVRLRA